ICDGVQSWAHNICHVTSKAVSLKLHLGLTKTPRALFRYLRRMPFEGMNRHFGVTNTATTCTRCGSSQSWRVHSAVPSRPHAPTLIPDGQWEHRAVRNHEQIREFCQFLVREWGGNRHHCYSIPAKG